MTERRTIDKLETDPSKAEEIAFIEEVAESVPDNSYLRMLFTKDFMGWVAENIRNDFNLDMYEYWNDTEKKLSEERQKVIRMANEIEDTNKVLAVKSKALSDLQEVFNTAQEAARRNYDKLELTMNDTVTQLKADIWNYKDEITQLNREIVELKAKLYDMMVAKEN